MALLKNNLSNLTRAEYLKVEGLNTLLIVEILSHEHNDDIQEVLSPVWNTNEDIFTHIDTSMHHLCLDVTTSIDRFMEEMFNCKILSLVKYQWGYLYTH